MTKHTTRILMILGMLLVATGGVAAAPGVPHNFFGEVEINGEPAPDGIIIEAQINDRTYGLGTTEDGRYGYDGDSFYVEDPLGVHDGNEITFYVEDEEAATYAFSNGISTRLDLSVEMELPSSGGTTGATDGGSSGGSGGGSSSGGSSGSVTTTSDSSDEPSNVTTTCTPDWECSEWTECSNFNRKRVCIDRNSCGTDEGRPALSESCDLPETEESAEDEIIEQSAVDRKSVV